MAELKIERMPQAVNPLKNGRSRSPLCPGSSRSRIPIEALPERMQAAVKEVHSFVKAPLSMVASSSIAALSVAAQALIDVRRDEELLGPVSRVSRLTSPRAESGKRQVDKMFTRPIQRVPRPEGAKKPSRC